jgi:hypothetical protein
VDEEGAPSSTGRGLSLNEGSYTWFVASGLAVWLLLLAGAAVLKVRINVDAADLSATAQIGGGLSAVALALLTFVRQHNPRELYLSVALGTLSFFFVVSSLCAALALMLNDSTLKAALNVSPFITASALVVFALFAVGKIVAPGARLRGLRAYALTPLLTPLALIASIVLPPPDGPALSGSEALPALAMLLLVGGMVELATLSIVLVIFAAGPGARAGENDGVPGNS